MATKKNTEKTNAARIAELKKFVKEYFELVDKYQVVLDSPIFGVSIIDLENERKQGNSTKNIKAHLKELKKDLLVDCTEAVDDYSGEDVGYDDLPLDDGEEW